MSEKISLYVADAVSNPIDQNDYMDFSNWNGEAYDVSKKIKTSELEEYLNGVLKTYYNEDGALPGHRTVDMSGFRAIWNDGNIILQSQLLDAGYSLWNTLSQERGSFRHDVGLDSGELSLANASGQFFLASDGNVTIKSSALGNSLVLRTSLNVDWLTGNDNCTLTLANPFNLQSNLILGTSTFKGGITFNSGNGALSSTIYDRDDGTHNQGLTLRSRNNVFEFLDSSNSTGTAELRTGVLSKVRSISGDVIRPLIINGGVSANDVTDGIIMNTVDNLNVQTQRLQIEAMAGVVNAYFSNINGLGINKIPTSALDIGMPTEDASFVDAGSTSATEQDWIEVQVGGNTGYVRVFATK